MLINDIHQYPYILKLKQYIQCNFMDSHGLNLRSIFILTLKMEAMIIKGA